MQTQSPFSLPDLDPTTNAFINDMARRCIMIPKFPSKESAAVLLSTEFVHPDDGHVIPGLPPVIWEWLKLYPFEPLQWAALQNRITAAVAYRIQDGCRKTAATYYGALRGVAAAVALIYPNRGYRGIVRHHLSPVSRTEAKRFYNINPADFMTKPPV